MDSFTVTWSNPTSPTPAPDKYEILLDFHSFGDILSSSTLSKEFTATDARGTPLTAGTNYTVKLVSKVDGISCTHEISDTFCTSTSAFYCIFQLINFDFLIF